MRGLREDFEGESPSKRPFKYCYAVGYADEALNDQAEKRIERLVGPRWRGLGLHVWALWVLAAAPLLDLLRRYPEFLIAHDIGTMRLGLLLAIACVALPAPWVVLAVAKRRRVGWPPLLLGPPLVLLGLTLAVPGGLGRLALPAALGVAGVAVWSYYKLPSLRRFCTGLVPIALVGPLLLLADDSVRRLWLPYSPAARAAVFRGAPVVVLILDELPVATLLDDDGRLDGRRFPHLAALAAESHWFDNVASVNMSTPKAISALLTGMRLPAGRLPVARDLPQNLFTLLAPTHRVVADEPVTRLCPKELNDIGNEAEYRPSWLADTGIVALHLVTPEPFADRLPAIDAQWAGFGGSEVAEPAEDSGKEPSWREIFRRAGRSVRRRRQRLRGFERMLTSIDSRRHGALYFSHLSLPHRPWAYLPSGSTYRASGLGGQAGSKGRSWPDSVAYTALAYQRHLLQAEFVDGLIGRLVARLREQGIYDSALVAITADHGISFLPGEKKRMVTDANRFDVLNVPLVLKLPGQREGHYHPELRSTLDLLPTILATLDIGIPEQVEGGSLLDPSLEAARTEPWRAALDHRRALFGSLAEPGAPFAYGSAAGWIGRSLDDLRPDVEEALRLDLLGPGHRFEWVAGTQPVPVWVHGRLSGRGADGALALGVAIDSIVRSTAVYDPADGSGFFRALLPEESITEGDHELTVIVMDPETEGALLPVSRPLLREKGGTS